MQSFEAVIDDCVLICVASEGIVTTSTCSSVISTNTTYVRNPNYPSSYTPTSAGTCSYTVNKVGESSVIIHQLSIISDRSSVIMSSRCLMTCVS